MEQHRNDRLLRRALLANALFSALTGLTAAIAPGFVGALLGVSAPLILRLVGAGLLVFSVDLALLATRKRVSPMLATLASLSDFAWVVGTIVLLAFFGDLVSDSGAMVLGEIALLVAIFGVVQLVGVRRVFRSETRSEQNRVAAESHVDARVAQGVHRLTADGA